MATTISLSNGSRNALYMVVLVFLLAKYILYIYLGSRVNLLTQLFKRDAYM